MCIIFLFVICNKTKRTQKSKQTKKQFNYISKLPPKNYNTKGIIQKGFSEGIYTIKMEPQAFWSCFLVQAKNAKIV